MRPLVAALAALVVASTLTGCLGGAADVVASAPRKGNGLTLTVSANGGPLGGPPGEVTYSISYGDEHAYPPPGLETMELDSNGLGSKFIPYKEFVIGNGDYRVSVGDGAGFTQVQVQKYVQYVFINPYLEDDEVTIDLTLQSGEGGRPTDRIIAKGLATFDIDYRGENGSERQDAHSFTAITNPDRTFTRVSFPVEEMEHYKGEGYYSVDVTFDNYQADGNLNVPLDPTFGDRDPPRNWVYVEDEGDEDDGILPP